MNEQTSELMACPFCGDRPSYYPDPDGIESDGHGNCECRNIECPIGVSTGPILVSAWNTRTATPPIIQAAEKMAEALEGVVRLMRQGRLDSAIELGQSALAQYEQAKGQ